MQAGISELISNERLAPVSPLFPKPNAEALFAQELPSVRHFCQLQIDCLLHQFPQSCIQLSYFCFETHQRQKLQAGSDLWMKLEPEKLAFLDLEQGWYQPSFQGHSSKIPAVEETDFYYCSLTQSDFAEYLLIAVQDSLSEQQKHLIETVAQLLRHHLATIRELHRYRQQTQHLKQTIHQTEHQLRTPIALSQIYTEVLLQRTAAADAQSTSENSLLRSHISQIQDAIEEVKLHLKQLTKPSSEQQPLTIGYHDLQAIVTNCLKGLHPWLNAKNLTVQHPGTSVILEVDAWQLKQVFDILITNAIHYSPEVGVICCTWQVFQHEVLIELWDQGAGLSEEDLKQVFTPYYSRRPGGTGLGLAIAQQIIQAHSGNLWASNVPGGGAKFSFTLPRRYSRH